MLKQWFLLCFLHLFRKKKQANLNHLKKSENNDFCSVEMSSEDIKILEF